MKARRWASSLFLVSVLVVVLASCESPVDAADEGETILVGTWTGTVSPNGSTVNPGSVSVTLAYLGSLDVGFGDTYLYTGDATLSGGAIDGTYDASGTYNSTFGTEIVITNTDGSEDSFSFVGTVSGDTFSGTYSDTNSSGPWQPMSGSATLDR